MGLFSFLGKNKQDRTAEDSGHFYRAADDAAPGERARTKRAAPAAEGTRRGRDGKGGADPMLPEKKRARRRLVGAIALALAAAVGLPMLLDSEPKPLAGDIAIQIPPKDKVGALPAPSAPSAAVNAADSVDRGEEIVEPPSQAAAKPAPAKPAPALAVAEVRAQSKPDTAIAPAKPEPAKVEHVKPEQAKLEPKHEQPKPEHKAAPKPDAKPESKSEPKLADKPKAPKVEDKPAHAQPADDSVRALAILEGKAAEKAASDKAAAEKAHEAEGEKVVLQVAALGSAEKAAELQARLREAGIHSYTQKVSRPNGDLIRVKVGPFSRDEADKVRARLGKLGLSGTAGPA
jgi:DedD protein